ncbi:hypothetical protein F0562_030954 [Nyssa sinensis]|uniref:Protein kinase domain-containing protein n=1 Tax=Nyssa sinensis TaxID=561372 RepID=A0A5J5AV35_9ASTE|nr:hypothetical protein F0562_030954 [Nyssa sinensis]
MKRGLCSVMLRRKLLFAGFTASVLLLFSLTCTADESHRCDASSCGNIHNISYPFRLKSDPQNCGLPLYELACESNRTILSLDSRKFYVRAITHENYSIRVVDPGLDKDNCSSFPLYSLYLDESNYFSGRSTYGGLSYYNRPIIYMGCADLESSCITGLSWYGAYCGDCYARSGDCYLDSNNTISCYVIYNYCNFSEPSYFRLKPCIRQIFGDLRQKWEYACTTGAKQLGLLGTAPRILCVIPFYAGLFLSSRFYCGIPCILGLLVYKLRRRHLSMYDIIEEFLQSHSNLMPIRYAFSDIKKMTNGFKDKLGEGGYGTVYKGKLRSGILVAVKMMGTSKATGQEFINEVGTIGRIHHVNVVQLIGFCAEGPKRALVYDFMPNGSLEKYIFPREEGTTLSLSCEKMYEISLGVARGIQYLHRGCDMQILHFDIKPHNILLDENFNPKVSDFGLAKLYPTDDSIVYMTAARGTMGYMAPELFYKNIGGVSYKADVYSFGMLLMEMAGRRKNLNAFADHLSQIYFPSWVYDQFNEGKDIEMGDATEEERKMVKKMIIVALWCIQMKPGDRPSMNEVIRMLEGNVEQLQMPPKPFLTPKEMPTENH